MRQKDQRGDENRKGSLTKKKKMIKCIRKVSENTGKEGSQRTDRRKVSAGISPLPPLLSFSIL